MALLSLDQQSDAAGHVRGIESNVDQAYSIIRTLENCEDTDELGNAADTLRQAARFLLDTANDLDYLVDAAVDANVEECAECGTLCSQSEREEHDGYCSRECACKNE